MPYIIKLLQDYSVLLKCYNRASHGYQKWYAKWLENVAKVEMLSYGA